MQSLSVSIITFNEEKNIARCLDSVKEIANEIIVVDSHSTDHTENICKEYGVKFFKQTFLGYIEQKNYALDLCKHQWVLCLDADECLSTELVSSIRKLKQLALSTRHSKFCCIQTPFFRIHVIQLAIFFILLCHHIGNTAFATHAYAPAGVVHFSVVALFN